MPEISDLASRFATAVLTRMRAEGTAAFGAFVVSAEEGNSGLLIIRLGTRGPGKDRDIPEAAFRTGRWGDLVADFA